MKTSESVLLDKLKKQPVKWFWVNTYKSNTKDKLDLLYRAIDRADELWGKNKRSEQFRKLIDKRELSIYDHSIEDHYTGSAIVMNAKTENVLMVFHPWYRLWLQLGGHDDGAMDPIAVSATEAMEESGIDNLWICDLPLRIDPHPAFACKAAKNSKHNHHYDICYLVLTDKTEFTISDESLDMRWFSIKDMKSLVASGKAQQRAVDMAINAEALYRILKTLDKIPTIS